MLPVNSCQSGYIGSHKCLYVVDGRRYVPRLWAHTARGTYASIVSGLAINQWKWERRTRTHTDRASQNFFRSARHCRPLPCPRRRKDWRTYRNSSSEVGAGGAAVGGGGVDDGLLVLIRCEETIEDVVLLRLWRRTGPEGGREKSPAHQLEKAGDLQQFMHTVSQGAWLGMN